MREKVGSPKLRCLEDAGKNISAMNKKKWRLGARERQDLAALLKEVKVL